MEFKSANNRYILIKTGLTKNPFGIFQNGKKDLINLNFKIKFILSDKNRQAIKISIS